MFNEASILYIQVIAAILMGVGYVISEGRISKYEATLNNNLNDTKIKLISDIDRIIKLRFYLLKYLVVSIIFFCIPIANMYLHIIPMPNILEHPNLWNIQIVCLTIISAIGLSRIMDVSKAIAIYWLLPTIAKSFIEFLRNCEKGPIATLGFILLLVSFLMRYLSLT